MELRLSELDGETLVAVLEPGDKGPLVDLMDERQNGFSIWGEDVDTPVAVIDGRLLEEDWCTNDHLMAIEAHELGHLRLKTIDEEAAEREGMRLLGNAGLAGALDLLKDRGIVHL
jgi:hypothetical protein